MKTENVLQSVLSHFVVLVVTDVQKSNYGDNQSNSSYYPSYNVSDVVGLDIHVKRHGEGIHGVPDEAGVLPFIRSSYRVDSENAAVGGGKPT